MAVLQVHPICERASVAETKTFSPDQFFVKIRADFIDEYKFQVRIYYNRGHIDYAFQLFTNAPLLRWDNKEEFAHLKTYPHHHHDHLGNIKPSPLTGDPAKDIELVLREVSEFISSTSS